MRRLMSTIFFLLLTGLIMGSYGSISYAADSGYPNRPITAVVPFAPGGMTDIAGRLLMDFLEKELKQSVVVSNKPGGAQTVGGYAVASAKPDGYTLLCAPPAAYHPEVFSYFFSAPYSSKDLRPICRFQLVPLMITVRADAPYNSLKELVEYARKNPPLKYGTFGKSSTGYIGMSTIARAEKLNFVDVPYTGDGELVPALLGGHVPVGGTAYPPIKALVDAKKLKVLAMISEKRLPFAPDIPTIAELGYKPPPGGNNGLYGPRGTPDEVVKKVSEAVKKIVEDNEFQNKAKDLDLLLDYQGPDSFEKLLMNSKESYINFFREEGLVKK
jgi:tripartite-type tricarboxylate transporter receptor subunit TctC